MDIIKQSRDYLFSKNIWCYKKHGDTSYAPHWHDYYEIIFYQDCAGTCILNGEEFPITKSCIFYLTPKDVHAIHSQNHKDSRSYIVSFSNEVIDQRIIQQVSACPRILYTPSVTLTTLMQRVHFINTSRRKESHIRLMLEYILNAILLEILEMGQAIETENHNISPAIEKAILYIMTDPSKDFTLEEIAEFCHLSPSYFSTLFRQETGLPFTKYVNDIRIDKAKHLLQESKKSVLDISLECGYNTLTHFIKTFKKTTGMTPSKYRELHTIQ